MIRVLVDADLLLEVLLNRSGFVADAEEAFEILQSQRFQGYVSELGLEKIHSVLSKLEGSDVAEEIVAAIEETVETCCVNSTLVQQARSLNIRDFESAVEVVCATATNIGAILTSDPQAFAGADLPVLQVCDLWQRQHLERMLQKDVSPVLLVGDLLDLQRLEELLETGQDCLRQIEKPSPTEPLDNDSQHLDFSRERQNFDAQFRMLLEQENSEARLMFFYVRHPLSQFHLLALQLAQNSCDVQAILQVLNQQKQIEREHHIKVLQTLLDADAIEGWQLAEVSKRALKELMGTAEPL
jgi:predicted nucleic acid-binding protein